MRLLAINSYDKDPYVRRWIEEAGCLGDGWRIQVTVTGGAGEFPGTEVIRCENPEPFDTMGYRSSLAGVRVDPDVEAVVSVHAKTWLTNVRLLDRVVDRLVESGKDAALLPRRNFDNVGGGEFLFLFATLPGPWRRFVSALGESPKDLWNEVAARECVDSLGLDVLRISCLTLKPVVDGNYVALDVDGSGIDLFGCEPAAQVGFGHYERPEGYRAFSVGLDGRASRVSIP